METMDTLWMILEFRVRLTEIASVESEPRKEKRDGKTCIKTHKKWKKYCLVRTIGGVSGRRSWQEKTYKKKLIIFKNHKKMIR